MIGAGKMASVTKRISQIELSKFDMPIKVSDFVIEKIDNDNLTVDIPIDKRWLVGLAVDYLVRLNSNPSVKPIDAFNISLQGAKLVNETSKALKLINSLNNDLESKTIKAACKLCGYDVALRQAPLFYKNIDEINPSATLISSIRVLVERTLHYLSYYGGIKEYGTTFEGGYTDLVDSGDCDYLTGNGLWDLKITDKQMTNTFILQLLAYYTLGMHSERVDTFKRIKSIGIINPLRSEVYYFKLYKLSNSILNFISHTLLGYKLAPHASEWYKQHEVDQQKVYRDIKGSIFEFTDFNIDNYPDGIHDITINDYCTYYVPKIAVARILNVAKPKFTYTKSIKFIKRDGYVMFVSVSLKGSLALLRGGKRKLLRHPLKYYYDNLPQYVSSVLSVFRNYWDALNSLKKGLRALSLNKEEKNKALSNYMRRHPDAHKFIAMMDIYEKNTIRGHLHGSIIDLSFRDHLYINPIDKTIHAYHADDSYSRDVYPSISALLNKNFSKAISTRFNQALIGGKFPLAISGGKEQLLLETKANDKQIIVTKAKELPVKIPENKSVKPQRMTGDEMYKTSIALYYLQSIYDYHWITEWDEELLTAYNKKISDYKRLSN